MLFACGTDKTPIVMGDDGGDASSAGDGGASGDDASMSGTGGTGGSSGTGGDAGNGCECSGVNDCCDGCLKTNVCDGAIDEPQCQIATCDAATGCAITNMRELLPCNDGDASTLNDRCHAGVCMGSECACSTNDACCDGCSPRNVGNSCTNADHYQPVCTSSGECAGTPCECDSGPCCDGCFIRSIAWRCLEPASAFGYAGGIRYTCSDSNTMCQGYQEAQPMARYCDGASSECTGRRELLTTWFVTNYAACDGVCTPGAEADSSDALCMSAPMACD